MELQGRTALVTGGASGIGAACCRAFAARGARVAVVDTNVDGAEAVASEIGGFAAGCDVGDEAAVNAMIADVERRLGPVEVCFNNAGIAIGGDVLDTAPDVWDTVWSVNVMAHVSGLPRRES